MTENVPRGTIQHVDSGEFLCKTVEKAIFESNFLVKIFFIQDFFCEKF